MRILKTFFTFGVLAFTAVAQTDRGTITGTVLDPAGAVIPNVPLQVRNIDSGTVYEGGSSATGNYTIPQLPVGNYELTVTAPGFKKYVRPGIPVSAAVTVRVDATLEVGAATESVTVQADAPLLKTESGELSHQVNYDRANNIPVLTIGTGAGIGNIRNPLQVVTLLPGASFAGENTLRINGMPSSSQAIRIEGQDATNGMWRQLNQTNQVSVDAIQEVAIQTSNFAAEYGQAGGGYFNYTTRSGTNQWHGSAYDYFVNEWLNAGTPFTDAGTSDSTRTGQHIRNRQRKNNYGFSFGGPIAIPKIYNGRDRSFFFFNFEQFRESQNIANGIATVPTPAFRTGDFSGAYVPIVGGGFQTLPNPDSLGRTFLQNQIFDPLTDRSAPDGTRVRDPFTGNIIPTSRFDPVAAKVQAMLPQPLGALATQQVNNYAVPIYSNYRHTTNPSVKLDHVLSPTMKLSGFYSQIRTVSPQANGYTQPFTAAEPQDTLSHTIRISFDQTITPTVLLHLGVGLQHTNQPAIPVSFDQSSLGWKSNFFINQFPNFGGMNDAARGGNSIALGTGFGVEYLKDIKPTANANLTWVKGNHTYKFGGEAIFEGFPQLNYSRANGIFGFSGEQTRNPWENGQNTLGRNTGFAYASFMLGSASSLAISQVTNSRLGNHSLGFYAQDTWKVNRKFTLDYGLRYDYVTLLKEQYGRMQSAAFDVPNPLLNNRLGSVIYEATCNCNFNKNYPNAWGPRVGAAYQINEKTVLRAGFGVVYGSAPNNAFLSYSVPDFYNYAAPGYGQAASTLVNGNPYGVGNVFGNPVITWPDFAPHYPFEQAPGIRPPQSPFISIDRNAGRPPRILQWSIGLQRQVLRDVVVEAAYVANRGVWWTAPLLATTNYNALTPQSLAAVGLNINDATDRGLLTQPISSPAVIARFPYLANPNNVYPGFPGAQPLNQALRPFPQWNGVPPFLGPPLGNTWYDSLQAKATKRFSQTRFGGLDLQAAFTFQKELSTGVNSDTSYLTPQAPLINDVFNRGLAKQISGFSRPLMLVLSFNYQTPGWSATSSFSKAMSWAARGWQVGGVLRYQSGAVIRTPGSNNQLLPQLARGPANNPATWGGGNTFYNRVAGQPYFLQDPNCHCFDPTRVLTLNPAAWSDAAAGQFGTSAPYYNDYRWQRQPSEALSFGRIFRLAKDGKVTLNVRAEFQNVFNRTFLSTGAVGGPGNTNPATPTTFNNLGALTGGYGFVNTVNGAGTTPRSGQIVARVQF